MSRRSLVLLFGAIFVLEACVADGMGGAPMMVKRSRHGESAVIDYRNGASTTEVDFWTKGDFQRAAQLDSEIKWRKKELDLIYAQEPAD